VTGTVPLTQLFRPSVRCRVNDNARGVGVGPPCALNPGVKWVGVCTVVSINVLGAFAPLPSGEGGNTNSVCDARGVALTAFVGAVSVHGKGTQTAGGLNDLRREDRGALDVLEVEESIERAEDEDAREDEDVTEPREENRDESWEVEGDGMTWIWMSEWTAGTPRSGGGLRFSFLSPEPASGDAVSPCPNDCRWKGDEGGAPPERETLKVRLLALAGADGGTAGRVKERFVAGADGGTLVCSASFLSFASLPGVTGTGGSLNAGRSSPPRTTMI
jgi:hypothetical protein